MFFSSFVFNEGLLLITVISERHVSTFSFAWVKDLKAQEEGKPRMEWNVPWRVSERTVFTDGPVYLELVRVDPSVPSLVYCLEVCQRCLICRMSSVTRRQLSGGCRAAEAHKSASGRVLTSGVSIVARRFSCHRVLDMKTNPAPEVIPGPPRRHRSGLAVPLASGGTRPPQVRHKHLFKLTE